MVLASGAFAFVVIVTALYAITRLPGRRAAHEPAAVAAPKGPSAPAPQPAPAQAPRLTAADPIDDSESIVDPECRPEEVRAFLAEAYFVHQRFYDDMQRAGSTSRIALSGVVGDLQASEREFLALRAPKCAEDAQVKVAAAMMATIDGFLAFMREGGDDFGPNASDMYFEAARDLWVDAGYELDNLKLRADL